MDLPGAVQKSGHSQTCFASHTLNTGYYTTITCMHILVYIYKDSASLKKLNMCCRLNMKENGHAMPDGRCQVAVKTVKIQGSACATTLHLKGLVYHGSYHFTY